MSLEIKEDKIYRIATTENYADEFDYPIISYIDARTRNYLLLHQGLIPENCTDEMSFGTNEDISIPIKEALQLIMDAEEITIDQYKIERNLYYEIAEASIDIADTIIDALAYNLRDTDETRLLTTFEEILENQRTILEG